MRKSIFGMRGVHLLRKKYHNIDSFVGAFVSSFINRTKNDGMKKKSWEPIFEK